MRAIPVVVYQPGSQYIQLLFFDDLATTFEDVGTYSAPLYLAGDFNVRLDRLEDPSADRFR
jgi:hypothetical protein